jgi:hypothetical protein
MFFTLKPFICKKKFSFLPCFSLSRFHLSLSLVHHSPRIYEGSGGGAAAGTAAPLPETKNDPFFLKKKPFSDILFSLDSENLLCF